MTPHTTAPRHREFSSRRAQVQEQITQEFLEYTTTGALAQIQEILNAVNTLAQDGPANSDTLMNIGEAMMIASKLADEVTKSCAAEATAIDVNPRDAAKTIRISPNTLKKWIDKDDHTVELPDNPWWITTPEATPEATDVESLSATLPEEHPVESSEERPEVATPHIDADTPNTVNAEETVDNTPAHTPEQLPFDNHTPEALPETPNQPAPHDPTVHHNHTQNPS